MIYTVRRATSADAQDIIDLRLHAEQWLRQAGVEQWTITQRGIDAIQAAIDAGTSYVIQHREITVAHVSLAGPDLDFWAKSELDEPALYLYKLMVHSSHRGRGLGDAILDWSCSQAEQAGAAWLRIDVWRSNTRLHDYYRRRGFEYVRTAYAPGRNSGALFQRPTSLRLATGEIILHDTPGVQMTDTYGLTREAP